MLRMELTLGLRLTLNITFQHLTIRSFAIAFFTASLGNEIAKEHQELYGDAKNAMFYCVK